MDALRTACRSHLVMKNIDKCIENATQSAVCCTVSERCPGIRPHHTISKTMLIGAHELLQHVLWRPCNAADG